VWSQYRQGYGWTATRLGTGENQSVRAAYGLSIDVTRRSVRLGQMSVKVVVRCASGLVEHWGGSRIEP
jgi:hypothetical protein